MAITGGGNVNLTIDAITGAQKYRSDITNNSASWDVTNLVAGTLRTVTVGVANMSGCTYDRFMDRVWFIRNDFDQLLCYPRSSLYDNTAASSLTRTISLTGGTVDAEGVDGPWWNASASAYESVDSDEAAGAYFSWTREWTEAQLTGSGDISVADIQKLTYAAAGTDNNSGAEGVAYDQFRDDFWIAGEGQQASTPRKVFKGERPANRTTDYTYLDAEFTVTEPWDPEVEDHMTLYGATGALADLSDVAYHEPSDTLIWLSQTDERLVQTDLAKNIQGTLDISAVGMTQPEGVCFIGDDLIVCGETNEFVIFVYTP